MKNITKAIALFAALVMLFAMAACSADDGSLTNEPLATPTQNGIVTDDTAADEVDAPEEVDEHAGHNHGDSEYAHFVMDYSAGIDEFGYWEGVVASDCLEKFAYAGIEIPYDVHTASPEAVQAEIDYMLDSFKIVSQVTDRAVVDGDMVNIDYVGSVDGVAFENGSTGGTGTDVTIGVTSYIDDFLQQLIGHMPGDTFDVNVTFPEEYGVEELNGKDAVFVTTVNYISISTRPEFTDEFAAENLTAYGWSTTEAFIADVKEDLKLAAVNTFLQQAVTELITIRSIPDSMLQYQKDTLISYYSDYAAQYNMELEPFITSLLGLASVEELLESSAKDLETNAAYLLAMQLIAEDLDLKVSEADLEEYFIGLIGTADYAVYAEQYGRPYLAQAVLSEKIGQYLRDNATYLEA